ncbi:MAG: hypothetical protein IJ354_01270 [Clostridia bacterium]|nr:hypothetical protein [Clostridia bacterium]
MMEKIKDLINRKIIESNYVNALNVAASLKNQETFGPIKNCNVGKEVAICGGGPTLKQYEPIKNAMHVALNRALLNKKIKYDWFVADDWDGVNFFQEELAAYDCKKFFGHQIGGPVHRQIPESYRIKCNALRYYTDSYLVKNGFLSKPVCDIDKMAVGNMPNIALSALQIILFTNPSVIYLVGCDASKGHFVQPATLNSERIAVHEKDLKIAVSSDRVIQKWNELKEFADAYYPETKIISINPVGLKGIFIDKYQPEFKSIE